MDRRMLALILSLLTYVSQAQGAWRNTLTPTGTTGAEILLADNGASDYRILLPAKPTDMEQKAADELQKWLKEMSGATIPIAKETADTTDSDKVLSIGNTQFAERLLPGNTLESAGREGYTIFQTRSSLIINGGPMRGVINGVFCLLEEDLGCRWYAGESAEIPSNPTLRVRIVSRTFNPPLDVRYPFYHEASHPEEWALRNRYSSIQNRMPMEFGGGRRMPSGWFVHSFGSVLSQTKDFAEHPEYFALIDGKRKSLQLCLTNPDVLRITIEKARKALDDCPTAEMISISNYDGVRHCECEQCAKIDEENASPAGSNITFVNQVAEALEATHPQVTVLALAYLDTLDAPTKVKPRHNVAVQFCNDLHSWRWPLLAFTDSQRFLSKRYRKALSDWSKICDKIYIWDYTTNFSHYIAPMPNMHVIQPSVKFYLDHNVKGIMFQGSYQSPGERGAMRTWVMTRHLWDPSRNVNDLIDDFVTGYYKEAAEPIAAYYKLLDDAGRANQETVNEQISGIRFGMDAPFITREFIEQSSALLKQAESLCQSDEMRRRVQLEKIALLYVKLVRGSSVCDDNREALLNEFETITKREKITHIAEVQPGDVAAQVAEWRKNLANPTPSARVQVKSSTVLFIDDSKVATSKNLSRTMHQPTKRGAVLTPDLAAGETMIQARSAPMWIPDEKLYRMQYIAVLEGRWQPLLAESTDGVHWTRPDFKRENIKPKNRILVNASETKWRDSENVVYDPDDANPARRYKALAGATGRLPCISADCREFNVIEIKPLPSGDESQLVYDRKRRQFIASVKTSSEFGRSVGIATSEDFEHWTPVTTVFHTDVEDQKRARGIIRNRVSDKTLMPLASVDPEPSADHVPNLKALGTWGCDVYNMAVFPYADGYVGLPAVFYRTGLDADKNNTDGFHEIQLAWSRDLKTWERIGDRKPFIGPSKIDGGLLGVFDRTQLLPTSSPIEHGDELWFYYSGLKWRDLPYDYHPGMTPRPKSEWSQEELADVKEGGGAVCLAVLRRDGFVSLDAGDTPGQLTTKPLPVRGNTLFLNIAAAQGEARVELVQAGQVIPGYSFDDCVAVQSDGVRCEVRWKNADVSQLKGEMVQLRIRLRNASLYAVSTDNKE